MRSSGKVVITGGSGFLGLNLARALAGLHDVVIVSRSAPAVGEFRHVVWDGESLGSWADELDGALAVVNLAGRSVDCVKTPDNCDEILRSRVVTTRLVGEALRGATDPPKVWVQMSTAHIYGDPPRMVCTEDSPTGYGLAPFVGEAWEKAMHDAAPEGIRKVILRTSFVLGRDGGALKRLVRVARFGLGGRVARGTQGISWLHEDDMNRLFVRAIEDSSMAGVYIATSPNPVPNAEFMRRLRRALRTPIGLPAFGWMVRIGAPLVLKSDPELALYGRYCVSKRLAEEGFEFQFPTLEAAFADLF